MQQLSLNVRSIKWRTIKAIIMDIIIAFIGFIVIIFAINLVFGKQIQAAINIVNMISIDADNKIIKPIEFSEEKQKLVEYPEYGTRYGNIKIDSIGINLPLYYGDMPSTLQNGIGQSSGAYFPGEGGSIICMGHNTKTFLYDLPTIANDAIIEVNTSYGDFKYQVYQTKVVSMYNQEELPIQKDEEILMLYTCYPVNTLGHKTDRFVVYAKRADM